MLKKVFLLVLCFLLVSKVSYAQKSIRFSPLPYKPKEELLASFLPLLNLLEKKLGVKFELVYEENYQEFINKLVKGEADLIVSGPLPYYMHVIRKGYTHTQPVVYLKEPDGRISYRCYLIVHKDGPKRLKELKGPFALPQKYSTCSYFSLSIILSKEGMNLKKFKYTFFDTHSEAVEAMLRGEYQGVTLKDSVAERYVKGFPLRVLAESPKWPAFFMVANTKTLKSDFIEKLRSTLISLQKEELEKLAEGKHGFAPAKKEDFDIFKKYEANLPE